MTNDLAEDRYCFDCEHYHSLGDELAQCKRLNVFFHFALRPSPNEATASDAQTCPHYAQVPAR